MVPLDFELILIPIYVAKFEIMKEKRMTVLPASDGKELIGQVTL